MSAMPTVGLFYGSSTCYTEIAAEKIREIFENKINIEIHNVASTDIREMANYDHLILGIPTWDYGELQEDWEKQWSALSQLDLTHKTIALYGLGDQVGYPEWFQDALGYLYQVITELGANVVGYWPTDGYQYTNSLAVIPESNLFVGLALDDETEFELSEQRLQRWCEQILKEFDFNS